MAYQLWRVFMKKYTKVRIGLHKATHQMNAVTPSTSQCDSFDEESWKPTSGDPNPISHLSRSTDTRQSTSKRVKTYLKKCKNSLGRSQSTSDNSNKQKQAASSSNSNATEINHRNNSSNDEHSSWYVTDDVSSITSSNYNEEFQSRKSRNDSICSEVKFASIEDSADVFEDAIEFESGSFISGAFEVELVDNPGGSKGFCPSEASEIVKVDDFAEFDERDESIMDMGKGGHSLHGSTLLYDLQMRKDDVDCKEEDEETEVEDLEVDSLMEGQNSAKGIEMCTDVTSLVDNYFGDVYRNFANTRKTLVRQARDLLVCEYFGCLQRFEEDFCKPASILLKYIKDNYGSSSCTPRGWPICLGANGILVHLGAILCPTRLQNGDGYLCVKKTTSLKTNNFNKATNKSISNICSLNQNNPRTIYESASETTSSLSTSKTLGNLVSNVNSEIYKEEFAQLVLIYRDNQGLVQNRSLVEYCEKTDDVRVIATGLATSMDLDRVRMCDGKELVQMLQNLMVSIEQHSLHPIPIDDLIYPCSHCLDYLPLIDTSTSPTSSSNTLDEESITSQSTPPCSCQCTHGMLAQQQGVVVQMVDTGMQTTGGLFEVVEVIPHIDSDEEEQGKGGEGDGKDGTSLISISSDDPQKPSLDSSTTSSALSTATELPVPTRITDIPEKLLMSGINLPGTHDVNSRPIILCFAECVSRSGLNKYEIARLLLYYNTIPDLDELRNGFTILLLAESDQDNTILELIDKAAILVANHITIARIIIWKPGINPKHKSISSKIQAVTVSDPTTLAHYIHPSQISTIINPTQSSTLPSSSASPCSTSTASTTTNNHYSSQPASSSAIQHDQLEWVEFYRQLEPFQAECRRVGRGLLTHLAQMRLMDDGNSGGGDGGKGNGSWSRGMVAYQCRQQQLFSTTPLYNSVTTLRASGPSILTALGDRAQWLKGSSHVKRALTQATETYAMTDRVAQRLQQLEQERKERLRELRRMKVMQEEATELLAWVSNFGEQHLKENLMNLRTAVDLGAVKNIEKTFEAFYFEAMRHIDKSNDLTEECTNLRDFKAHNFKETSDSLKTTVKSFTDRLEHLRESIENTTRCFQLLEDCDSLESNRANEEDFDKIFCDLALKSGNDKLIQISNHPRDRDKSAPNFTSTPIKQPAARRRSVSSQAFIFKCNHRADGVNCTCKDPEEDDLETTVSYQLKKQFLQMDQKKTSDINSKFLKTSSSAISSSSDKSTVIKDNRCVLERKVSATLDGIKEVRESVENLLLDGDVATMCDSGVSTGENSVGDEKVVGCCSCDSSVGEDRENFEKSDDIDDHFDSRKVPPIPSNSHLYYNPSIEGDSTDDFDSTTDAKTQKILLYIMREMIQTERDYVASLDYIIVNYIPELTREDIPQALRGQRNVVFGNVEKIYEFHSQYFLRELEQYELCPLQVGQIFLKYQGHFALYALYNKNKPKSDSLMSEFGSKFFKSKQLQINDLMDLASYLLKPVQRMGKYALLLQQMLKACPKLYSSPEKDAPPQERNESEELVKHIREAEEMVRFQLRHGNDLLAMDSIRECDVNLKEQGALIRQNEFMLIEGRTGKKSMRQVFLFEELILFSKARRLPDRKNLDLYIYKSSIKTSDIGLTAKIGESSSRFEIWFRKRKPNDTFILQASSEDVKKAWTEELSQLLWKQAITNKEVRQQEMSSMGIGNKPCLEIRPSVNQISDRSISYDQLSRTAPRFRNSISGPSISTTDLSLIHTPTNTLPTSSSSSSSTTSSTSSGCTEQRSNHRNQSTNTSSHTLPNIKSIGQTDRAVSNQISSSHGPMILLRPHSVISMISSTGSGSSSSGSSSSGGSSNCSRGGGDSSSSSGGKANADVEGAKSCGTTTRSGTLNSQCSIESGIIADMSHDDCSESAHWSMDKSQLPMSDDLSHETTTEL